jgi:6-pyruvoyltetrahydropterin/6-carboxytetrahydropterin synthase
MSYTVTKIFKCDIAERNWIKGEESATIRGRSLYNFDTMNPEFQIHGHTLHIKVTLEGETLDDTGFILDTDVLKELVKDKLKQMDHAFLIHKNDPIFPTIQSLVEKHKIRICPTDFVISYENLSKDFYDHLMCKLKEHGFDKYAKVREVEIFSKTIGGSYSGN